ncbi:sulfonate ABC transporter permease, partial [Escherichia coli]|nr:sulfonate ABC transporter permease [Escherichia coli]
PLRWLGRVRLPHVPATRPLRIAPAASRVLDGLWLALVALAALAALWMLASYIAQSLTWRDGLIVFGLGLLTLLRVAVLIVIASL